ncbi:hypothetical protein EBT16_03740 [bacterium]|nr:hypothetical protein [bacterium]
MKEIFTNIYQNWGFGGSESRSGPGSSLDETADIRAEICKLAGSKNIRTVTDIPCGDFNWMKEIVFSFDGYTGGDIVHEIVEGNRRYSNQIIKFIDFDLTEDKNIPESDLLIVRDLIGHLPLEKGKMVIKNILDSKCRYLLSTTWYNLNDPDYHRGHVNRDVPTGRWYPVCLSSDPFNLPAPEFLIEEKPFVDGYESGNRKGLGFWDLDKIRKGNSSPSMQNCNSNVTIVTGLWNLGRGEISSQFSRPYEQYLERFVELLKAPVNMFIFVSSEDEELVWKHRDRSNTFVRTMSLGEFDSWFSFFDRVQEIRSKSEWRGLAGWLPESPQANLKYYNPIVMSKMFMLNDASIHNPFSTDYFYWIDAGITNTVHPGYFSHDRVFDNVQRYNLKNDQKFIFISYPYEGGDEIHGFERKAMARFCDVDYVKYVCRGGFFGGPKEKIQSVNALYYWALKSTLGEGFMGTEECIHTILAHRNPELIHRFELSSDGLVWPFFESLKDFTEDRMKTDSSFSDPENTAVYVITFNSPTQFEELLRSMEAYDRDFITKPRKKFLLDNSSDLSTTEKYKAICDKYGYEHIKKDNLGICGGRQFIAEHAEENGFDFYMFFEDDMFFYTGQDPYCKNGFRRKVSDLYRNSISIARENGFDFLKLSFTEFYGDNGTQWSWYNIPQDVREKHFPEKTKLPVMGTDPNAPRTKFGNIRVSNGIPYVDGEIYYCNWPQVVSRIGNKKMFLTERWAHPFEGTWMSYIFQETKKGNIRPGLLLASPTQHERRDFYDGNLRKES